MRRRRRITLSSPDGVVLEGRCRGRRPRKDVCLVSPLPDMYMVPDESIAPIYLYLDRTSIAGPVGGHVQGSLTSKRYMRDEIWSLISYVGAPSWFITFA